MNLNSVKLQFAGMLNFDKISDNKWEIYSPFFRVNGEMLHMFLIEKDNNKYVLSDDGYTLVNLDVVIDVASKDAQKIIKEFCQVFNVKALKDRSFEMPVQEEDFILCLSQFSNFCSNIENMFIYFD